MPDDRVEGDDYGTDLALDETGDLVVWPNGGLATVSGPENCVQAIKGRLRTFRGELPLWPAYGTGLPEMVGGLTDEDLVLARANAELKAIADTDERFLQARETTATAVEQGGAVERVVVKTTVELAGGEALAVADLENAQVEEILDLAEDLDATDPADFGALDGEFLPGEEFFTDSADEEDDLKDAQSLADTLAAATEPTSLEG